MRYLQAFLFRIAALICTVQSVLAHDPTYLIPAFLLGCAAGVYVHMGYEGV